MRAYLAKKTPTPPTSRVSWIRYLLPCYVGLFAWLGYFQGLAGGTVDRAPFGVLLFGLVVAGLLGYFLFFRIPATMGMQTGYAAGVLGSSTFGSAGGQFVPGLLIALVQSAWLGVAGYYAARSLLAGIGVDSGVLPIVVAAAWCVGFGLAGCLSLNWVARLAFLIGGVSVVVPVYGLFVAKEGLALHGLDLPEPYAAFVYIIHLVTAFFATAAATSPGLARHVGTPEDLRSAGWLAIAAPAVVFGGIAILTVAGAKALNPGIEGFGYLEAVIGVSGVLGTVVALALVVGAAPASAFVGWMAVDSFEVMLPGIPRLAAGLGVGVLGAVVAATGAPSDLPLFLTISAALCAPLCGIMAADYWQHDKRWPHTRPGVNYAGFGAWLLGIGVGMAPLLPIPEHFQAVAHPAAVFSCLTGFIGYVVLGNLGLKPYQKHRRKRVRTAEWGEEEDLLIPPQGVERPAPPIEEKPRVEEPRTEEKHRGKRVKVRRKRRTF